MRTSLAVHAHYDIAIVGAGPVGLAVAVELARRDIAVVVLDRRPPLGDDPGARPQLLVARAGDLAHLAQLGIELADRAVISPLSTRTERDFASGVIVAGELRSDETLPTPVTTLWELSRQRPIALVPIARLQQALVQQAIAAGASVFYDTEAIRVRRHARAVSIRYRRLGHTGSLRATVAIIATGAPPVKASATRRLIAGVFAIAGDRARWVRAELPLAGFAQPIRCTMLQTSVATAAGTAMLIDPQLAPDAPAEQLHAAYRATAHALELAGAPELAAPQLFTTGVSAIEQRYAGGDGRAPLVIAGDAAQTGHVFSGQTCFVNLTLGLRLGSELARAKAALTDRAVAAPALLGALARYQQASQIGAAILAAASQRHHQALPPGAWALAGIARA